MAVHFSHGSIEILTFEHFHFFSANAYRVQPATLHKAISRKIRQEFLTKLCFFPLRHEHRDRQYVMAAAISVFVLSARRWWFIPIQVVFLYSLFPFVRSLSSLPTKLESRPESFAARKTDYDVNFTNVYKPPETTCEPQFHNKYTTKDEGRKLLVHGYTFIYILVGTVVGIHVFCHVCTRVYVWVDLRK